MEEKRVTITINPRGEATVEAHNFHGQGCADATKNIERALAGGSGEVKKEYKPEWSQPEQTEQEEVTQSW